MARDCGNTEVAFCIVGSDNFVHCFPWTVLYLLTSQLDSFVPAVFRKGWDTGPRDDHTIVHEASAPVFLLENKKAIVSSLIIKQEKNHKGLSSR